MQIAETARISQLDKILSSNRGFIDLIPLKQYNTGSLGTMTRVIIDRNAGFCGGVRRAIEGTEQLLTSGPVSSSRTVSYGQLVHNREVTDKLSARGLTEIDSLKTVRRGDRVVIRAHGISPQEQRLLDASGAQSTDLTCPRVKRVHKQIMEKRKQGFRIVIAGDPNHPEVRAHTGYGGENALVVSNSAESGAVPVAGKIAVFAQTTITPQAFAEIVDALRSPVREMVVVDSLCPFVLKRQRWIEKFSRLADASLILGGRNSSNTLKLVSIAANNGPAFHLSSAAELDERKLLAYGVIAMTAGASTSDQSVRQVLERLENAGARIERR